MLKSVGEVFLREEKKSQEPASRVDRFIEIALKRDFYILEPLNIRFTYTNAKSDSLAFHKTRDSLSYLRIPSVVQHRVDTRAQCGQGKVHGLCKGTEIHPNNARHNH